MDDLHGRFRRLDRVATPNLWNEAVARAVELELAPRRAFNPSLGLIAAALLLAALAGSVAVGAWLDRPFPTRETVTYDNGMIVAHDSCGRVIGLDSRTFLTDTLVPGVACDGAVYLDGEVAWSADGRSMAYLAPSSAAVRSSSGVWIYDAQTGETRELAACTVFCNGLAISPDGARVAYLSDDEAGQRGISLVEVDGGAEYRRDLIGVPGSPAFSPDGGRLALTLLGGKSGVHVIDVTGVASGGIPEPTFVHGIVEARELTWSPDGAWISFERTSWLSGPPSTTLWIVRPDGSDARQVVTDGAVDSMYGSTWSPDSASIAFLNGSAEPPTLELWTVRIDGGPATKIYDSACCVVEYARAAWSPDGEWIAFGVQKQDNPAESGIALIRPDGSEVRYSEGRSMEVVWQPLPQTEPSD